MLYQRYFLRMNQSNMTHLLGLLLALCSVIGLLQLAVALFSSWWGGLEPGLVAVGMTVTCCVAVYAGESTDCLRFRVLLPLIWTQGTWRGVFPLRQPLSLTEKKHPVYEILVCTSKKKTASAVCVYNLISCIQNCCWLWEPNRTFMHFVGDEHDYWKLQQTINSTCSRRYIPSSAVGIVIRLWADGWGILFQFPAGARDFSAASRPDSGLPFSRWQGHFLSR